MSTPTHLDEQFDHAPTLVTAQVYNFAEASRVSLSATMDDLIAVAESIEEHIHKFSPADAAMLFWTLKETYEKWDSAKKAVHKVVDALDRHQLPELFDKHNVDQVRIPQLGRSFTIQTKYSASMPDKAAGYDWLRNNGGGDLIQETVNAGTLTAFVKDMILEQGVEPPEGVIDLKSYKKTGSNKYTPK